METKYLPKIINSNIISGKTGLDVKVLDFSNLPSGSHKYYKAESACNQIQEMGGGYALLITSGNAGKAFDLVAKDYPNAQVIKFVDETQISNKNISIDKQESQFLVKLRAPPLWMDGTDLGIYWRKQLERFPELKELTYKLNTQKNLKIQNAFNVTNCIDFGNKTNPYFESLKDYFNLFLDKYDYVFAPIGSGELFSGLQKVCKNKNIKTQLIGVTTKIHPLSNQKNSDEKGIASKLNSPRFCRGLGAVVSQGYEGNSSVYFANDRETSNAYETLISSGLDLETSLSGSISLAPILSAKTNNSSFDSYLFKSIFYNGKNLEELALNSIQLNKKDKILVVNTGGREV
jgi:hypothetical protein